MVVDFGAPFMIVVLLAITIWVVVEMKRLKHKVFAIVVIFLILFTYFSFAPVITERDLDLTTADGIETAATLYFSWLGSVFTNLRTITSNVVSLDWGFNETQIDEKATN